MSHDLIEIRRTLHAHPEIGFCENWTSSFLAQTLRDAGIAVHTGIAQTGLVAIIPGTDATLPTLGYRADIDALPMTEKSGLPFASTNGCMHACGHDMHMTIALGVALRLAQAPLRHPVAFVFQPNEEGAPGELPSGAEAMCDAGILDAFRIQSMFALHCDPTLRTGVMGICEGTLWAASGRFKVNVQGQAGHAAYPDRGHDALLAASRMIDSMYVNKARRRKLDSEILSVCQFEAGDAFNVIASHATFQGIVRGPSRNHLSGMFDVIKRCAAAIDIEFDTHSTVETYFGANPVVNDAALTQLARKTWGDAATEIKMTMASEDFSHFSERVPSFYAMLGVNPGNTPQPPLHAENFFADENAIAFAVDKMVDLLNAADR